MQKVTKQRIAAEYGVDVRTITNWMRERRISFLKIGRLVRFDQAQVAAELERAGLVQARESPRERMSVKVPTAHL